MRFPRSIPAGAASQDVRRVLRRRDRFGNRSGQSLALVAVVSIPLLGMVGLAVDVGMLMNAHGEAHRAAEAGALAGAGAFYCFDASTPCTETQARIAAEDSAMAYARRNYVHKLGIDSAEVNTEIDLPARKVRVTIRREAVPTFFAKLIGFDTVPIEAYAAAVLSDGGVGQCLMPFFGPDLWFEDADNNQIPEASDPAWEWDGPPDAYQPLGDPNSITIPGLGDFNGTGYGSNFRDGVADSEGFHSKGDWGREINVKVDSEGGGSGALGTTVAPGNFLLWAPPIDDCDAESPDLAQGANEIGALIGGEIPCSCPIELGVEYEAQTAPGQKIGKVREGLEDRLATDPDASWDEVSNDLVSDAGYNSGRVVTIAIADPRSAFDLSGASTPVVFNNFARIFLQGWQDDDWKTKTVVARFMGFVNGGPGSSTGSLVKYLHLVE